MKITILIVFLLIAKIAYSTSTDFVKFGNAVYVNLSVGERFEYLGRTIEVIEL